MLQDAVKSTSDRVKNTFGAVAEQTTNILGVIKETPKVTKDKYNNFYYGEDAENQKIKAT